MEKPVTTILNGIVAARVPADEAAYVYAGTVLNMAVPAIELVRDVIKDGGDASGIGGYLAKQMKLYHRDSNGLMVDRLRVIFHALNGLIRIGQGNFKEEAGHKKISMPVGGYGPSYVILLSEAEAQKLSAQVGPYIPLLKAAQSGVRKPLEEALQGKLDLGLYSLEEAAYLRGRKAERGVMDIYAQGGSAAGGRLEIYINGGCVRDSYHLSAVEGGRPKSPGSNCE